MNKGTGSEANSSLKCDQRRTFSRQFCQFIELSILIAEEHADSFINPLHLLTSLLITSLNFHQSYFSNFAFKY